MDASTVLSFEKVFYPIVPGLDIGPISFTLKKGEGLFIRSHDFNVLSHLINLASSLETPHKGQILWWDAPLPPDGDLWARYGLLRRIGMVSRQSQLLGRLTLLENMLVGFEYAKEKDSLNLALKFLRKFNLLAYQHQKAGLLPEDLRRLALYAVALSKKPPLFLMEGPRQLLDNNLPLVWGELRAQWQENQTSVIIFERNDNTYQHCEATSLLEISPLDLQTTVFLRRFAEQRPTSNF